MQFFELLQTNTVALYATVFVFGLLVGSFLNVVIFRLPVMLNNQWQTEAREYLELEVVKTKQSFNLVTPASTCPKCGHHIRAWENIPVFSYLFLKGRCSNCKTRISVRYPIVEFITGLISLSVAYKFGASFETILLIGFFFALIALTGIDFDEQILPDIIVLPLLWIGLLANIQSVFAPIEDAIYGAVAGYLFLWSIYWLFKLLTGKEGMGFGDFKLFAAFGAWFGWQSLPLILLLSSLVGAIIGIAMILSLGKDKNIPIPFGPYLCGAALVYVFWGEKIIHWYLGTL